MFGIILESIGDHFGIILAATRANEMPRQASSLVFVLPYLDNAVEVAWGATASLVSNQCVPVARDLGAFEDLVLQTRLASYGLLRALEDRESERLAAVANRNLWLALQHVEHRSGWTLPADTIANIISFAEPVRPKP